MQLAKRNCCLQPLDGTIGYYVQFTANKFVFIYLATKLNGIFITSILSSTINFQLVAAKFLQKEGLTRMC